MKTYLVVCHADDGVERYVLTIAASERTACAEAVKRAEHDFPGHGKFWPGAVLAQ